MTTRVASFSLFSPTARARERREREMKERRVYTLVGLLLLIAIGYLNWSSSGGGGESSDGGGVGFRIPIPWLQPRMGFIGRNGTRFVDLADGSPVYVNGWNSYWMMYSGSRRLVSEMLRRGRAMGMTVCRTWAFNDGTEGPNSLQISPGRFDERVFQALDFVVYEARRNHIRLILSLVNNLDVFGGKSQYVKWAQAAGINVSSTDSFFWNPTIKGYYKDYVKTIIRRKNSYSGIRYYDEPAIFAWELINEPRCESNSSAPFLQAWITEMSSYIKSLDKNHLVTVGLEGFYGPQKKERLGANPGEWAASLGSDFIENSADENIDFASVHAYPDNWIPKADLEEKVSYLSRWIDSHLNDSEHVLKKPVLFSEVGSLLHGQKNGTYDRDILLKIVYDKVYASAKSGQAGAGALIWQLMVEGMQKYHDQFALVAREHKTTYQLIMEQSCRMKVLSWKDLNTSKEIGQSCMGALP